MTEGIIGALWAFSWGSAAASGALLGAILGMITRLPHRAVAAFMSLGAGVLLSAASFKVASEALTVASAASTVAGIVAGAATFSIATQLSEARRTVSAAGNASRSSRKPRRRAAAPRSRSALRLMLCRRRWSLASP